MPYKMNKMQVAHQQLNVAIRLHFLDDDPASVLTLAGAAAGVFRDLVEQMRIPAMADSRSGHDGQPRSEAT
jgi:hypothetical protein